jgi:hypothetical protein
MKKIIPLALCFMIVCLLTACGTNNNTTKPTEPSDTNIATEPTLPTETETTEPIVDTPAVVEGILWHNNSWTSAREIYEFELGEKFEAGNEAPELVTGDICMIDGIMYIYNAKMNDVGQWEKDETMDAWSAKCHVNKDATESVVRSEVYGKPVVSMAFAFIGQEFPETFQKVVIPETVTNIDKMLDFAKINSNITFEINSTPTSFVECLKIYGAEIDMGHLEETGELKWYSDYVFTIVGDCEQATKELIAKETGDVNITVNVE